MKQYQYNKAVWRKTGDGAVFLRDARGLLGNDSKVIEIPEVVYENGEELPVIGIWPYAFQGVGMEIRRIFIPKTVRAICDLSFYKYMVSSTFGFDNLEEIVVDESNEFYSGVGPGLYSKDLKHLVFFPGESSEYNTIPEQTVLDASFFWNRDNVLMPERIRKFNPNFTEEEMFYYSESYEEKDGGRTLHKFDYFADEHRNVNLLQYKGETPIGRIEGIDGEWNDVVLPDSVKIFSSGAFMNAHIKSINLPKMIEKIELCAFFPLNGEETLDIPATVECVDPHGFDEVEKVKHLILPRGIKDCEFLFNFLNLETIVMKDSANGLTNFVLEDGVLYSSDKSVLVKYLKTKKEKVFRVPDEVKYVGDGAFRNNPYVEMIIVPHHNINTIIVELPLTKDDKNLEISYSCYSQLPEEYDDFMIWHTLRRPLFGGCTALKALVYDDGTMVFGNDFDVVKEGVTTLVPEEMMVMDYEHLGFLLVDGALCWEDTETGNLFLEHYPIEKKDKVLVIDKRIEHITSLENRFIKKLVIYNTHNKELFSSLCAYRASKEFRCYKNYDEEKFRNIAGWWVDIPSYVNLPALEEIEVIGDDGCFFVENGCLCHMEGNITEFDIDIPEMKRYGELGCGEEIVQPVKVEHDGKHFYCPKYEMAVRKADNRQYFARFKQQLYGVYMEDFVDEDTGDLIKMQRFDLPGSIMADEIELSSDSCILAEFDKKGGMTPITEYEYQTIGSDNVSEEELERVESKECLQAVMEYCGTKRLN